jgi:protein-S-isoprenylcysteine O-methyltransferase Ste14
MIRLLDYAERLFVVLISIPFLIAFAMAMPNHPQVILVAISEMLAVLLILTRRPGAISATPYAFLIGIIGTTLPLLIRPAAGSEMLAPWLTSGMMSAGLALSIFAKLALNRSFGIIAANRGVKSGGPYRFVRHPMYLGYITTQVGFLLDSFTLMNLLLYAGAWLVQIMRIREEEVILVKDDVYAAYSSKVRWRLVPGLY